jgi:hypothetical protein
MSSFATDLAVGKGGESTFILYLESIGAIDIEQRNDYWWDIKCDLSGEQVTFETKLDLVASRTGNAAIEIKSRNYPSGICTSKADYWIQIVGDKFYILKTSELRYLILTHNYRIVTGGDNNLNELVLIDLAILEQINKKIS